jgi:hypothetical protein
LLLNSLIYLSKKFKLRHYRKLLSYQRGSFIEKGGWNKMPGEEKAGPLVARACADGLEVLLKK